MQTIEELLAVPRQITREDVMEFLTRNKVSIQGAIETRETRVKVITTQLKNLERSNADTSSTRQLTLKHLREDYECALLQFTNDKNRKYNALEIKLRRAIEARDKSQVILLTYGMEQLKSCSMSFRMRTLLNTIEYHQRVENPDINESNPLHMNVSKIRSLHKEREVLMSEIIAFKKTLKDSPIN